MPLVVGPTHWPAAIACIAAIAWPALPVGAQSGADRQQVAREIRATVAELQRLDDALAAERRRLGDEKQTLEAGIERLEADLAEVRSATTDLETRIEQRRSTLDELESESNDATRRVETVADLAAKLARSLAERARRGIPLIRQAADRLAGMADALDSAEATAQADAIADLHALLGDYVQGHRQRSIENRLIDLPGGDIAKHAYVVRLGSIAEAFVTEDGGQSGIASREPGQAWESPVSASTHAQLLALVAMLREQSPPRLIQVPLLLPEGGE